jgi:hypothetical protein
LLHPFERGGVGAEHPHTWAELLTLIGAIRRIAYDITLEAGDALRRIRDLYAEYDAGGAS